MRISLTVRNLKDLIENLQNWTPDPDGWRIIPSTWFRLYDDRDEEFNSFQEFTWEEERNGRVEIEKQLNDRLDSEGANFHMTLRSSHDASLVDLEYKIDDTNYTGKEDSDLLDI